MGIVDLVKGWRGAREGESEAPLHQPTLSTHPLTSFVLPLAAVDDASFLERLVATDGNPRLFMRALSKNVAV
ncbi:MAG: hypothetical protein LBE44_03580 [Microbacterium hominis]|nr:hypothetical protein [Microbacterium hominis]